MGEEEREVRTGCLASFSYFFGVAVFGFLELPEPWELRMVPEPPECDLLGDWSSNKEFRWVLKGRLRPSIYLMNERGKRVGLVLEIQDRGIRLSEAVEGDEVAISVRGGVVGRNIKEGAILYSEVRPVEDERARSIFYSAMTEDEIRLYERLLELRLSRKEEVRK